MVSMFVLNAPNHAAVFASDVLRAILQQGPRVDHGRGLNKAPSIPSAGIHLLSNLLAVELSQSFQVACVPFLQFFSVGKLRVYMPSLWLATLDSTSTPPVQKHTGKWWGAMRYPKSSSSLTSLTISWACQSELCPIQVPTQPWHWTAAI